MTTKWLSMGAGGPRHNNYYKMTGHFLVKNSISYKMSFYKAPNPTHFIREIQRGIFILSEKCFVCFHVLFISFSYSLRRPTIFFNFLFIFSLSMSFLLFQLKREEVYSSKVDITNQQEHNMAQSVFILTPSDILAAIIEPLPVQSPHRPLVTHLHHPAVSLSPCSQVLLLSPGLRTVPSGLAEGRPQTMVGMYSKPAVRELADCLKP